MPTSMIAPPTSHGTTRASASRSFPAKSGRKTSGPSAAPKSEPESTYEIPRARRSGGYMSAPAARARRIVPEAIPTSANPIPTGTPDSTAQPRAVKPQPSAPTTKPPAITGTRPNRSISRPAGSEAMAAAVRKIAGPSPRMPLTPVTRTRVTVETATTSCTVPDSVTRHAARRIVFFRIAPVTPASVSGAPGRASPRSGKSWAR